MREGPEMEVLSTAIDNETRKQHLTIVAVGDKSSM